MGTTLIFDKSALKGIGYHEAMWLDTFFLTNYTPISPAGTLADRGKEVRKGCKPEGVVGGLASRSRKNGRANAQQQRLLEGGLSREVNDIEVRHLQCIGGTCQLGVGIACTASDQCHVPGICNPVTGVCSNPPAPNGTACNDGNPCTLGEVCVGGLCAGSIVIAVPAETQNLAAANKTTYNWSPALDATSYEAVRGDLAALPVGSSAGGEVCFHELSETALVDTAIPASRAAFWYLSLARNPCGPGPIGVQSNGIARATTTCP